jgi:hypothetical protein
MYYIFYVNQGKNGNVNLLGYPSVDNLIFHQLLVGVGRTKVCSHTHESSLTGSLPVPVEQPSSSGLSPKPSCSTILFDTPDKLLQPVDVLLLGRNSGFLQQFQDLLILDGH